MRKTILILLAAVLTIGIAASYAKGSAANAERVRIQQQCELDLDCTFYTVRK